MAKPQKITASDIAKQILSKPLTGKESQEELWSRGAAAMVGKRGPIDPMDAQDISLASKMHSSLMEHGHGHWNMHDRGAGTETDAGHQISVHAFDGRFELGVRDWDYNEVHRQILPTTDPMRVGHELNVALAHPGLQHKMRATAVDRAAKLREMGVG